MNISAECQNQEIDQDELRPTGDVFPACSNEGVASINLLQRVISAARSLPLVGNAEATEIRYVMHFSEDSNICAFRPHFYLCWADVVSADFEMITRITNWVRVANYKSLYVLRIGLPAGATDLYKSDVFAECQRNGPGGCFEYALNVYVPQTHFARLDLTPDSTEKFFI